MGRKPIDEDQLDIPKRCTLIKHRVGIVKSSVYDLPDKGYTYGKPRKQDPEGAGEILSNWVTSDPSAGKESNKLIVFSNILAIKKGCVTAASIRQYAIDHPNIRRKETLNGDSNKNDTRRFEGPFGRKTVYAEERFGDILGAKFTNFDTDDCDYPDVSTVTKKGFMPKPKPTIASNGVIKARENKEEKSHSKHFIMKRFQNIPSNFKIT